MGVFVNELRINREKELEKIKSEGRRDGEKTGKLAGKLETAKNMLKEKIDISLIERVTGLKRNQFMK